MYKDFRFLLDVQANLPETSPFFICPDDSYEQLLFRDYIT